MQNRQKPFSRDLHGAHGAGVRGHELHIDEPTAGLHEACVKVDQRDLGRVGMRVEHGLSHEDGADEHTEHPADKIVALPHLDAVCPAEPMQLKVGVRELRRDPRGSATAAAATDDIGERPVQRGGPRARTHPSEQRVGHMHAADGQHAPRVRAPPGQVKIWRVIPGEVEDTPVSDGGAKPAACGRALDRVSARDREGESSPPIRPDQHRRGELAPDRHG